MLSASRPASTHRQPIARIILATMLLLVVLAGALPFSSLASSHACAMACCIGKPPHMAGSCTVHLGDEEQVETSSPEQDDEQAAHNSHAMHLSSGDSQEVASTKHQDAAKHLAGHHSKSGAQKSLRTNSVASQSSLTTPCSPECVAAASVYSQVRRPRDSASAAVVARPRPPTFLSFDDYQARPLSKSAERRRLSRPRAPPALLNNLSA